MSTVTYNKNTVALEIVFDITLEKSGEKPGPPTALERGMLAQGLRDGPCGQ